MARTVTRRRSAVHRCDSCGVGEGRAQPIDPLKELLAERRGIYVLKDEALATFADEMERQREYGNVALQHAAYVTADGELIVTGQGPKGAFAFTVTAGGWGWCRPLM